jgi:hypothetical protein
MKKACGPVKAKPCWPTLALGFLDRQGLDFEYQN